MLFLHGFEFSSAFVFGLRFEFGLMVGYCICCGGDGWICFRVWFGVVVG